MVEKTYIEREPVIQFIEHGLNEKKFGYDAIEILGEIQFTSAADVAPVKHGHWTQVDKNKCECSNCGIIVLIAVYPHGDKNYCPNCGARMDGGDKNED